MEYRKLISFGKNSYVISLPKAWLSQNKLQKGDLIHLDESGPNLILSRREQSKSSPEKRKVINVDGKSIHLIKREVNSAYILNNHTIVLKGEETRINIKNLQNIFQNLIALEVMEQTSNTIVAKDFLNMETVSVEEIIRKMDMVVRTMFKESCQAFSDENYENINERDNDVNRLYYLLHRTVLYNLDNPLKALKHFKLMPIDLMSYLFTGFFLEGAADEVRRTIRFARLMKLNEVKEKQMINFLVKVYAFYLETMKAVYNRDVELGLKLLPNKVDLNVELDEFEKTNHALPNCGSTIGRIRKLISYIHSLGRTIYQGFNYYADEA